MLGNSLDGMGSSGEHFKPNLDIIAWTSSRVAGRNTSKNSPENSTSGRFLLSTGKVFLISSIFFLKKLLKLEARSTGESWDGRILDDVLYYCRNDLAHGVSL